MNKKVLIITYYWPPSGGAGVQRWLKFAKYLPEFGWEPIVLTVNPEDASYPQIDESLLTDCEGIKTYRTKTFELYSLYTSVKKNKEIPYGGFSNEQSPNFVQKTARFIRGNAFIPDPRKAWNKYAIKKALDIIKEHEIDVVITTSPPHSTQLIGLEIKRKLPNIRWIADLRDPWTDIYYYDKFYPTKLARKIDRTYESNVVSNADITLAVSKSIKQMLKQRYNNANIKVLTNGYDASDFPKEIFNIKSKNRELVYTGTITTDYPIDEVIALAKKNPKLRIRFIGSTPREFKELIKKENLTENFIFQKAIPHNEITKEMVNAGILLLLIPKVAQNEGILTGKLFEYLGSQSPILAIGPHNGDAKTIISETNSGLYFDYDDADKITPDVIEKLYLNIPNNKTKDYSRKNITEELLGYL